MSCAAASASPSTSCSPPPGRGSRWLSPITVRIWHADDGQLLQVLTGPKDDVESVSYSPAGDRLVAASCDGRAYIFQCRVCIPLSDLVELAKAQVGSALTDDEREQYLREAGIEP